MKVQELLGKTVSVRSAATAKAAKVGTIPPREIVTANKIVDDLDHPGDPEYKWLELDEGAFANYLYPPNGLRFIWLDPPPPPSFPFDLYRVKWDHEVYPYGFDPRPAAFQRLQPFARTLLDEPNQRLWYDQIKLEGQGLPQRTLLQVWRWLTASNRFITNGGGPDILCDYITRERLKHPLPGIFSLASAGNVLKGKPEFDRIWYLVVETLTLGMSFPEDLSHAKYPYWIHYATTTTGKKLPDGSYLCNPFTTKIWVGRNAPHPLFASRRVRIDMRYLDKIPAGEPIPSPYNPPRPPAPDEQPQPRKDRDRSERERD